MHRTHFAFDTLKNWVRRRNRRGRESGQSIVVIALGLLGLMAFAGLVFDGGTAYAQFRRVQNAADAGALAGAQDLSKRVTDEGVTNGQICSTVAYYAHDVNALPILRGQGTAEVQVQYIIPDPSDSTKYSLKPVPGCHPNGSSEGSPGGKPRDDARGVRVTVSTTFNTFFLGMFFFPTGRATAHSSAEYGPASPINVLPLAKKCPEDTDPPCHLTLGKDESIWDSEVAGDLGWLTFNGNPSRDILADAFDPSLPQKEYVDDVDDPPCTTLRIGCWVQGTPGVSDKLEKNLNDFWGGSGRPMIILLYDKMCEPPLCPGGSGGSNSEYHIRGYAAFMLDADGFSLSGKYMNGIFTRWMDAAAFCKDCEDTGFYTVHLIPDVVEPPAEPPTKGTICVTVAYDVNVVQEPPNSGNYVFHELEDYYLAGAGVTISGPTNDAWTTQGISTNCSQPLDPGSYTVTETNPPGYDDVTRPNTKSVTLAAGATVSVLFLDTWNGTGTLGVYTRNADNGAVLTNLAAVLRPASNPSWIVGGPITSPTGTVYFRNRPPGNYIVSGKPAPGYDMVIDNVPAVVTLGVTNYVTITARQYPTGKICVTVWDDEDGPAGPDVPNAPPDRALWGAVITVAGTENRTHTMGDGEFNYCFENLRTGPYTVSEQHPPGFSAYPGWQDSYAFNLTPGETRQLWFRDNIPPRGSLCVEVFDDVTNNGLFDPLEVRLGGANITVISELHPEQQIFYTTNGTEPKCFSVDIGSYTVKETSNPPGYLSTTPDEIYHVAIQKDVANTIQFGDRTHAPTATPTRTRTPTPTRTNTPPPNTTPTPTPTVTLTPIPGAVCVNVYEDLNNNFVWDHYPTTTPTPTGTLTITPEPLLAPKSVGVKNSSDVSVGTWDGTGPQAHCFQNLWPGSYGVTETDPLGYGPGTSNNVTALVTSLNSTMVEFGDKLCFAAPPHMREPIFQSGNRWLLQWDNLPGTYYTVYGSANSIDPEVPTWTAIGEASDINYYVENNQGPYFYITATDNCGTSDPSNVVGTGVPVPTLTPTPTATLTPTATRTPTATPTR